MKKYILTLAIASAAIFAQAQNSTQPTSPEAPRQHKHHDPNERATHLTERMAKELNLTDDQKAKVMTINLEAAKKNEALRSGGKDTTKRGEHQKIEQERETKLKGVLTSEQFQKFLTKKEEMKQKRMEHKHEQKH